MRTHLHTARIVVRIILVLWNNYTGPGSGFGVNGITYLHSSQSGLLLIDTKFIIIIQYHCVNSFISLQATSDELIIKLIYEIKPVILINKTRTFLPCINYQ